MHAAVLDDPSSRRDRQNCAIYGATFGAPVPWMDARRRRTTMTTTVAQHEARGRVRRGCRVPTAGWKDILGRTPGEVVNDHMMLIAPGVTLYTCLRWCRR